MSRYYRDRPLEVICQAEGLPEFIRYRAGLYRVERIMEYWRDTGRWWEGESEKAFFRLRLEKDGIKEVCRDLENGVWHLYKSYD